jgi:hypothetical protein
VWIRHTKYLYLIKNLRFNCYVIYISNLVIFMVNHFTHEGETRDSNRILSSCFYRCSLPAVACINHYLGDRRVISLLFYTSKYNSVFSLRRMALALRVLRYRTDGYWRMNHAYVCKSNSYTTNLIISRHKHVKNSSSALKTWLKKKKG